jgi:GH15 family glucan-1,4-alpha-glucosidase
MSPSANHSIEFPPLNRHCSIGDRRTGALVAADGTINWFCVPNFDGIPIFGTLLDPEKGGFCRFGPIEARLGRQHYLPESAAVVTMWTDSANNRLLELTDVMACPAEKQDNSACAPRTIIRRLRISRPERAYFEVRPRWGFQGQAATIIRKLDCVTFRFEQGQLTVRTSFPLHVQGCSARAELESSDKEFWVLVGWNLQVEDSALDHSAAVFQEALRYWHDWNATLSIDTTKELELRLRRSAMTVHLLTHAEYGCPVAALTTSLPERIGGDRNYDYRFAWVRDASLSLAFLARLGKTEEVERYLDWVCDVSSNRDCPLQVCYRLGGEIALDEIELSAVRGYSDSRPVRYGNRAAKQSQPGSIAFFADCARIYVESGGRWEDRHWHLLKRLADCTCDNWHLPDNGIWELTRKADYVASKVLSWVVLERTIRIANLTGRGIDEDLDRWRAVANVIHAEVMEKGWNRKMNAFVQTYDSEVLDAAALLIPLMEFLPTQNPRVGATLAAIERRLIVNGFVYRFEPAGTLGGDQLPVGEYEGAFLPATFWYAHALAKCGRVDEAESILKACESIAGEPGLFAEEADPHMRVFLGNTPLLFAQVEYARAAREVAKTKTQIKDPKQEFQ